MSILIEKLAIILVTVRPLDWTIIGRGRPRKSCGVVGTRTTIHRIGGPKALARSAPSKPKPAMKSHPATRSIIGRCRGYWSVRQARPAPSKTA